MFRVHHIGILFTLLLMFFFISCGTTPKTPFDQKSAQLGTYGKSKSTYHIVAGYQDNNNSDHKVKLEHEGVLIAIEKAPRKNICAPEKLDLLRFRYPVEDPSNPARLKNMKRITDDPKAMFISHIVTYDEKENSSDDSLKATFLHNIYSQPVTVQCKAPDDPQSPYKLGWDAMDKLENKLDEKLKATAEKKPFTHIVILAMGWNNDQAESIHRYNKIIKNLKTTAQLHNQLFKPLVIGFSWPSVWGKSTVPGWKQLLHLFSYGNKADDADEIGLTYGNYIVNKMAPGLKQKSIENGKPIKIVLIGHSLGTRLLTRSIFSSQILKNGKFPPSGVDYVFGLEGAFSINRFVEGSGLLFPANLFRSGEGYPYSDYGMLKSKLIMTWSKLDSANPLSTILNGSAHIGGREGFQRSRLPKKREPFVHLKWEPNPAWELLEKEKEKYQPVECKQFVSKNKVFMTDVTKIVRNHNDICDFQMGYFIWKTMECFSGEESNVSSEKDLLNKLGENETCDLPN